MDLFDHALEQDLKKKAPLAARLRPRTLRSLASLMTWRRSALPAITAERLVK